MPSSTKPVRARVPAWSPQEDLELQGGGRDCDQDLAAPGSVATWSWGVWAQPCPQQVTASTRTPCYPGMPTVTDEGPTAG